GVARGLQTAAFRTGFPTRPAGRGQPRTMFRGRGSRRARPFAIGRPRGGPQVDAGIDGRANARDRRLTGGMGRASPADLVRSPSCAPMPVRSEVVMFDLSVPWWELLARGALVYVGVLVMVRLSGKRTIGEFSPFDVIVLLLLAEAAGGAPRGRRGLGQGGVAVGAGLILRKS